LAEEDLSISKLRQELGQYDTRRDLIVNFVVAIESEVLCPTKWSLTNSAVCCKWRQMAVVMRCVRDTSF